MKGQISEMELANFRARAQAALAQKAERGELIQRVAVGFIRTADGRLEKTPDARVREAIELVFRKFNELGSARRLFFWLSTEKIQLPAAADGTGNEVRWRTPRYHSLLSLLQNPVYAGAYAYGRTRTQVHLAQARKPYENSNSPRMGRDRNDAIFKNGDMFFTCRSPTRIRQ